VEASGEKGQYAKGYDDSGYSLIYSGANNTCVHNSGIEIPRVGEIA